MSQKAMDSNRSIHGDHMHFNEIYWMGDIIVPTMQF